MNNKELILKSVEYKYYKINFFIFLAMAFIWFCPFMFLALTLDKTEFIFASFIFTFPTSAAAIYYLYRMLGLIKMANDLVYQEVIFDEIHTSIFRYMYYTVKIHIGNQVESKDTKAIFNTSFFSSQNIEEFNNKKVLIGYNEKTNELITIKTIE